MKLNPETQSYHLFLFYLLRKSCQQVNIGVVWVVKSFTKVLTLLLKNFYSKELSVPTILINFPVGI